MRPDRAVVKKAIVDAAGNLSRAASLLGCTRQSLYTWIYQHGLERLAGIRMDKREELDKRERMDKKASQSSDSRKSGVYSGPSAGPILRVVEATQAAEIPVQATIKVPESFWRRVRIAAISEGCTVSEYVLRHLAVDIEMPKRKPKSEAK